MEKRFSGSSKQPKSARVNVKVELDDLMQRYFKNNPNENYETLLEEIILSRLAAISAGELIQ